MRNTIALILLTASSIVSAGPFLELAVGDFIGPNQWPEAPDCRCGIYLNNQGPLGYVRFGWETRTYSVSRFDVSGQVFGLHISSMADGHDTGIDVGFAGIRIQ